MEALDVLLESSARTLVVPIRPCFPKKRLTNQDFCWLTQEDLVRFFLNNIFLFSSIAPLSVTELGLVCPAILSVRHHDSAISALPLIRSALHDNTSVAVVTDDGKLIGEISPFTLSTCDETVAAAIASLSAGDLMAYIDCCSYGGAPESVEQEVKARLKDKGLDGMLEFLEDEELLSTLSLSSCSASSASSSSDEEAEMAAKKRRPRRMKSGSYSARMGRRSEEAIVCHPESSLVAVMVQALVHRVSYVWVVDEEDYGLVGIVTFQDVLRVFREQLQ